MAILEDPEGYEVDALTRLLPSVAGARVLEIGSGDGRLTRRYSAGAASIIAIDSDREAIDRLRAAMPAVDARALGIEDLALPRGSLDVVVFAWSL